MADAKIVTGTVVKNSIFIAAATRTFRRTDISNNRANNNNVLSANYKNSNYGIIFELISMPFTAMHIHTHTHTHIDAKALAAACVGELAHAHNGQNNGSRWNRCKRSTKRTQNERIARMKEK